MAGPSLTFLGSHLAGLRAAAVRVRDERCGEREQADCEHDERAVHARDLMHGVPPFGFLGAPGTLEPTANRAITSG